MRRIENHCCDCASPGYPCRGSICPLRRVEVIICDHCDREIEYGEAFEVDGEDLCDECHADLYRDRGDDT